MANSNLRIWKFTIFDKALPIILKMFDEKFISLSGMYLLRSSLKICFFKFAIKETLYAQYWFGRRMNSIGPDRFSTSIYYTLMLHNWHWRLRPRIPRAGRAGAVSWKRRSRERITRDLPEQRLIHANTRRVHLSGRRSNGRPVTREIFDSVRRFIKSARTRGTPRHRDSVARPPLIRSGEQSGEGHGQRDAGVRENRRGARTSRWTGGEETRRSRRRTDERAGGSSRGREWRKRDSLFLSFSLPDNRQINPILPSSSSLSAILEKTDVTHIPVQAIGFVVRWTYDQRSRIRARIAREIGDDPSRSIQTKRLDINGETLP